MYMYQNIFSQFSIFPFTIWLVSFNEQKYLILMKSNLSIFYDYCFLCLFKKSLLTLRSWRYIPIFSSRRCILPFTLRSAMRIWLILVLGVDGVEICCCFFPSVWISNWSSTIYWKDIFIFSFEFQCCLCCKSGDNIYVFLSLDSRFCCICSFVSALRGLTFCSDVLNVYSSKWP